MNIGIITERNETENRIALTPSGTRVLVQDGHTVYVESGAGSRARFSDEEFAAAGARIAYASDEVLERSDLLIKISALTAGEVASLHEEQAVLAFHHLAAMNRSLLDASLASGATLIGYEVIEDPRGDLPVLHAMSEIAGQLAIHVAAHYLETGSGGRGILLGGATGIPPAHVVVLGAGVVGLWAARTAAGNRAQVVVLDNRVPALRRTAEALGPGVATEMAHPGSISRACSFADVLIGAILLRGERTPVAVTSEMMARMKAGAVAVDVSIDQGGCFETSRPTTLLDPVFTTWGVTHYAVPNMASAVGRTASVALSDTLLPFLRAIAGRGIETALAKDPGLLAGVYVRRGKVVSDAIKRAFGQPSAKNGTPSPGPAGAFGLPPPSPPAARRDPRGHGDAPADRSAARRDQDVHKVPHGMRED